MISECIQIIEKKFGLLFCVFLLPLVSSFFISFQALAATDGRTAELIERAKKEGKLVIYSSISLTDLDGMVKKFKETYPFINVEYTRTGAQGLLNRIVSEARAKRYIPDVIELGTFELYPIKKMGLLAKYSSPEMKTYHEDFKDAEGYYTTFFITTKPISYNTKLVSPDKAPKSYEDLLASQWKGKIALAGAGGSGGGGIRWFICMMKEMGEKRGEDFMRKLAKQDPIFNPSTSLVTQLLAAAEFPIAANSSGAEIEVMKDKGASVDWIRSNPMFTTHTGISLATYAPHPNAGQLFVDFVLSKEGQEVVKSFHRIPGRSDVKPDPPKLVEGFKLFPYNAEWAEEYDRYAKKFHEIFR